MTGAVEALAAIVGAGHVYTGDVLVGRQGELRGLWHGEAAALVLPGDTAEVAAVVALCSERGWPVVPQGGNTGMCGGAVPAGGPQSVILGTDRLNRIRALDPDDFVAVAEAGVILADLQRAAEDAGCLFPLSLGAEGSCRIGGNLSTNAGGINVLRYGTARDLVLGLEVVLPDGRIWDGLRSLRKDNTGYALRHLFVGAEGTLGIITAASLKLFPRPGDMAAAFVAVADPTAAIGLLRSLRQATGDALTAFELIPRSGLEIGMRTIGGATDPLAAPSPWYVLAEVSGDDAAGRLTQALAAAGALVADAVLAQSGPQRAALWKLREISAGGHQHQLGAIVKHDISVPTGRIPEMIARGTAAVEAEVPGTRTIAFGHVGDGNLHFNCVQPEGADPASFRSAAPRINRVVHDLVDALGGSISAEHGIGIYKRQEMARYKTETELDLMRRIKAALDPAGIMNPGKVLPAG